MAPKRCWLLKSEPSTYSIEDLERDGRTTWEGVRNYQARNFLREMKVGDRVLFYHSSTEPPAVAGLARVVREAYPDPFAFDPASKYHDPGSRPEDPRWFTVDVGFVERFDELVPLSVLRADPALEGMELLRRGSRLSVQPVTERQYDRVVQLALGRSVGLPAAKADGTAAKAKTTAGKARSTAKRKTTAAKATSAARKTPRSGGAKK
ncbi:MAG TPA: EVE domain-containing protein [Vulgatibacter sp.]|nr:EVE domain-containing protein [Vulgatibacter sp.]